MTQVTIPKNYITAINRAYCTDVEHRFENLIQHLENEKIDVDELRNIIVPSSKDFSAMFRAGRGTIKNKKDPNAPKKAPSAYMIWLNENRQSITESFEEELVGREKVTKVSKKAGEMWQKMDEDDRKPYEARAKEKADEYKKAKAEYSSENPSKHTVTGKIDFNSQEVPDTPAGWNSPVVGKFLSQYAAKRKYGEGKFKTFDEAVDAAENLGDSCAGITRDKTGYTLRKTSILCENTESSECVSWTKSSMDNSEVNSETQSLMKKVSFAKGTKKPKKVITSKSKLQPKPQPKPQPIEEEQTQLNVCEVNIDGEDYLLDESSGDIYSTESHQIIGKFEDGELKLN